MKATDDHHATADRGQFHGGESSTINRCQTQAHDFGKAASQDLRPRMVDSAITGAEVRDDDYTLG